MEDKAVEKPKTVFEILHQVVPKYQGWDHWTVTMVIKTMEAYAQSQHSALIREIEELKGEKAAVVSIEKPDFEKLALDYTNDGGKYNYCSIGNHSHDCGCGHYEEGCEKIWTDCVNLLSKDNSDLKSKVENLETYNQGLTEDRDKAVKQVSDLREALKSAILHLRSKVTADDPIFSSVNKVYESLLEESKPLKT